MSNRLLLILGIDDSENATDQAFCFAQSTAKELVALQIINSYLYHYGHNDLIATRPSKIRFLLHIQSEMIDKAKADALELQKRAMKLGVALEIKSVETEDPESAIIEEARKGYEIIFLPQEKRHIFPLFERSLSKRLGGNVSCTIAPC
jgi:hypothetical protein